MMPIFDPTVNISDLILVGGGMLAFAKLVLFQREFNRDVLRILGKARPKDEREGVLGDIESLKENSDSVIGYLLQSTTYGHRDQTPHDETR